MINLVNININKGWKRKAMKADARNADESYESRPANKFTVSPYYFSARRTEHML